MVVGTNLCRIEGSWLSRVVLWELRHGSQSSGLAHDGELSKHCSFISRRYEYRLHETRKADCGLKYIFRAPAVVQRLKRISDSIEFDSGNGFCIMSANLRALFNVQMVLTLRDVTLEWQSKVMVHRSLTRCFKSVLLA
jgi:hypothetical protein